MYVSVLDSTSLNTQPVHGHAIVDDRATTAIERRLGSRRGQCTWARVPRCRQCRGERTALLAGFRPFPRPADAAPAGASIREQGTMSDCEALELI